MIKLNEYTGRILSYHEPVNWTVQGRDNSLYCGIELELAFNRSDSDSVFECCQQHLGKTFVLMSDGSIQPEGAELIIAPFALHKLKSLNLDQLCKDLINLGVQSWNAKNQSCGLHVHITRPKTERNYAKFTQEFCKEYKHNILILSGRKLSNLEHFANPDRTADKYSAINTQHRKTIEIRIFRGSLSKTAILGAVEFSRGLVEYSCTDYREINWQEFCQFCNGKGYYNFLDLWKLRQSQFRDLKDTEEEKPSNTIDLSNAPSRMNESMDVLQARLDYWNNVQNRRPLTDSERNILYQILRMLEATTTEPDLLEGYQARLQNLRSNAVSELLEINRTFSYRDLVTDRSAVIPLQQNN